jgi:transcriptional regulator with XRE-family HTH domain
MAKKTGVAIGVGMTPSRTKLGSFMRTRRLRLRLSQVRVAELAGLKQNLYSMFEIGKRKYLNPEQLAGLSRALECDSYELEELIPEEREPQTKLGKLIRAKRKEKNFSVKACAELLGISLYRFTQLEWGKYTSSVNYRLGRRLREFLRLEPFEFSQFIRKPRSATTTPLGTLVRERRRELNLSLEELAESLGVSYQALIHIETGHTKMSNKTSVAMLSRLAEGLGLEAEVLTALQPLRRLKDIPTRTPLGNFLSKRRNILRLTQKEVGLRIGVSSSVVTWIETGRKQPDLALLKEWAEVLECTIPPEVIPADLPAERARRPWRRRTFMRPRIRTFEDPLSE